MSRATNRRMISHQQAAYHVERLLAGPAADALAVAGKPPLDHFVLLLVGDGNVDQANRLVLGSTIWAGDAGDPDANIGIADLANVLRQGQRDLAANCSVGLNH